MRWLVLALIPVSLALSLPLTALMIRLGNRLGAFDSPGVPGQVKAPRREVPNTGGVAIFWSFVLPLASALAAAWFLPPAAIDRFRPGLSVHMPGIHEQTPLAVALLLALGLLHTLGLIDDRRPMGPWIKLALMAAPAFLIPTLFPDNRLLTLLDQRAGGQWLSILITALWFLVVTNAMNFMDNMDGLSAGVAATAAAFFLIATQVNPVPQLFVGGCLALLIGACLGFLYFNYPRRGGAKIFMGDGGSLVLGFTLAFLTVRTTYYKGESGPLAGGWYGVFMPLVVLAVPIYDFVSVMCIRISQGRPPFVGDMQHLSHRLVRHGLSRRAAVAVIWGLTAITGIAGVSLGSLRPWQAVLVGVQTVLILLIAALFEYSRTKGPGAAAPGGLP